MYFNYYPLSHFFHRTPVISKVVSRLFSTSQVLPVVLHVHLLQHVFQLISIPRNYLLHALYLFFLGLPIGLPCGTQHSQCFETYSLEEFFPFFTFSETFLTSMFIYHLPIFTSFLLGFPVYILYYEYHVHSVIPLHVRYSPCSSFTAYVSLVSNFL